MARRRDVVAAIIIGLSFVVALAFLGLLLIALLSEERDFEFSGIGGDVAVVEMFGVIDESTGRALIRQLDRWAETGSVKAVVVHINSPGGGAAISQEIFDAIRRLSDEKPVVAAMASVAASGGYLIACAADRIVANKGTLTGSIGVIMSFHTLAELLDKIGVGTETVKSGEMKDVGTYARHMTKKEELMLRSVIMDAHEQFVEAVSEGRGLEKDEIYPVADGSIFTGLQAYNLGLVDTLGGLKEAVDLAAELAGIEGEPKVIYPRKRREVTIFDLLGQVLGGVNEALTSPSWGPELLYLYQ